jgi:hypothetical protein
MRLHDLRRLGLSADYYGVMGGLGSISCVL